MNKYKATKETYAVPKHMRNAKIVEVPHDWKHMLEGWKFCTQCGIRLHEYWETLPIHPRGTIKLTLIKYMGRIDVWKGDVCIETLCSVTTMPKYTKLCKVLKPV